MTPCSQIESKDKVSMETSVLTKVHLPPKSDVKSTVTGVTSVGKEQFIEDTYFSLCLTCLK